ncbi:MAG TPA: thioredoxin domain-containing protein [Terriglobales bacterium]|nr:thioredoxin domain-containing protein [Terriglobales bacterium]
MNSFMHQMFGYQPELSWKINSIKPSGVEGLGEVELVLTGPQGPQGVRLYITPDGKHAFSAELMPFGAHPFAAAEKELKTSANGPTRGAATAPVTIVEFSDLQCPHCKEAQPTLEKLLNEDKNARLVFQNFPLPGHDWSSKAAAYDDCIGRESSDTFFKFVDGVFAAQSDINAGNADDKLKAIADQAGAKGADVAACAAKPETVSRVEQSVKFGKSLEVGATPTMFINGRKISGGVDYETLKKLVDFAAK